jgi:Mn-dependent DtxR family transcriptional regulator
MLTTRDREYLKIIFLLEGTIKPVGPSHLSKFIGVSKEAAFQEMRRLEFLGFGEYISKEGLKLNNKAVSIIENDAKRHHILEKFLKKSLNISHEEACQESTNIDPYISEKLMNNILSKIGPFSTCDCGCDLKSPLQLKDLKNCNWIKKTINGGVIKC